MGGGGFLIGGGGAVSSNNTVVAENADKLAALAALNRIAALFVGHQSIGKVYENNLFSERDNLAVAGALSLIKSGQVNAGNIPRIVSLCRFPAVRIAAYDYFFDHHEHDLTKQVLAVRLASDDSEGNISAAILEARQAHDHARLAELHGIMFRETGDMRQLNLQRISLESFGGWRAALESMIDQILIDPDKGVHAFNLCQSLHVANETELLEYVMKIFAEAKIFLQVQLMFRARQHLTAGKPEEALKLIGQLKLELFPDAVRNEAFHFRGEVLEKLGLCKEAYKAFCLQNNGLRQKDFSQEKYFDRIGYINSLPVFELEADPNTNAFMMLGFPRSGTTLLEKALSAHPDIETFEEIGALSAMTMLVTPVRAGHAQWTVKPALAARKRYYDELEHYRQKPGARVLIDKLPIMSASAPFLKGIFPEKKYIFSIRDPRDVVLSCFKQAFKPNAAMDNFTSFAEACRAYDFVMTQWFRAHQYPDSHVCYVRYEDVVTDFQSTLTRVLQFTGLDWVEEVNSFAEKTQHERVKTPSYQKVRSGLSIGVQSSWQKYEFLFSGKDAAPLRKWIEFWGYA